MDIVDAVDVDTNFSSLEFGHVRLGHQPGKKGGYYLNTVHQRDMESIGTRILQFTQYQEYLIAASSSSVAGCIGIAAPCTSVIYLLVFVIAPPAQVPHFYL